MTTRNITVVKRDNSEQAFDEFKICNAIISAFEDVYGSKNINYDKVDEVVNDVIYALECYPPGKPIGIEDIQDMIEASLMRKEVPKVAKQFVLYRFQRANLRKDKETILEKEALSEIDKRLSINQLKVLSARYLLRNVISNKLEEDPDALFTRVATLMALGDMLYDSALFDKEGLDIDWIKDYQTVNYAKYAQMLQKRNINEYHFDRFVNLYHKLNKEGKMNCALSFLMDQHFERLFDSKYAAKVEEYKALMVNCEFMPNTPTLMNSGTRIGGLSACFVLFAPDDSNRYIRGTLGDSEAVYKKAGGVGIDYSEFRPEGCSANGVPRAASGPIPFMRMVDTLTDVIKAGGKRRGANMGILHVTHPDIEKFITMKQKAGFLENFNVSVGITPDYWEALTKGDKEFQLTHATHKEMDKTVSPQYIWDLIALSAWKSAEPGVIFFDNINKVNHMVSTLGPLKATNPCGEQPLYPDASCTLGSINVSKCVKNGQFNWGQFAKIIRQATRFLDNVVSMNLYPTPQIEEMAFKERRIGLGIMGVADALFLMGVAYNSKDGFEFMANLSKELSSISIDESINLAMERGAAPLFEAATQGVDINNRRTRSSLNISQRHSDIFKFGIRNTWNTTIAPTGTIAMIAGCSYGIEPEFGLAFEKKVTIGNFYYANDIFAEALKKEGLYTEDILKKIADNGGSCQSIDEIPEHLKKIFVTAMDLHWADHIMAQGICQQYIDNAISKTINMSEEVLVEDINSAYLLAHETGCKGITVYRNNSRAEQVLHATSAKTGKQAAPSEFTINWIQEHVTNPYARNRLFDFFKIAPNMELPNHPIGYMGPFVTEEFNLPQINDGPTGLGFIKIQGPKDICEDCKGKLVFVEGCKVCPTCVKSYCHV